MTQQPKICIQSSFLALVAKYVPLNTAILATLGGKGGEADLWKDAEVGADRGWLIERGRSLSRNLIRSFPFRHCGNLAVFPRLFCAVNGRTAGIDGFHLDLCGTIEPRFDELKNILPLVNKSQARCLAITVADERRNLTLEQFKRTAVRLTDILGQKLRDQLLDHFLREQEILASRRGSTFDPEKAAKREAGVFLSIALLLSKFRGSHVVLPDRVERYIYVSNYGACSFRMRSYFFHFGQRFYKRKEAVRRLAKLWQSSKLLVFAGDLFEQVVVPDQPRKEEVHMPTTQAYNRLEALALAAGGEVLEQFMALKSAAGCGEAISVLRQIKALTSSILPDEGGVVATAARQPQIVAPAESNPSEGPDEICVKLNLLRAASQGRNALKRAYEQAFRDLGLTGRKHAASRNRKVGAMFAWTQGRFRGKFVKACVKKFGAGILQELATLYSAVNGAVTESELKAEMPAD